MKSKVSIHTFIHSFIALEVVWTFSGWVGVLVAAIGMVHHIRTHRVPLVHSLKSRIYRYHCLSPGLSGTFCLLQMLTLLVVEVGAMMTEFVQQAGTNGFLSNLTAVVIPTASVAYTLWCKSFSRPTATSSNGSFAFQPKTKFSSFMSKAIKSTSDNNLDWRSGYVRFDITNWGEGAIVEWTSYKRIYQLRHKF